MVVGNAGGTATEYMEVVVAGAWMEQEPLLSEIQLLQVTVWSVE